MAALGITALEMAQYGWAAGGYDMRFLYRAQLAERLGPAAVEAMTRRPE